MPGKALVLQICRVGALSVGLKKTISPSSTRGFNRTYALDLLPGSTSLRFNNFNSTRAKNMSSTPLSTTAAVAAGGNAAAGPDGGGGNTTKSGDIREQKRALRKRIKSALKMMGGEAVESGSAGVAERLLAFPQLQEEAEEESAAASRRGAVSVYMSMPGEVSTPTVVSELFRRGKKIYIPKVLGSASADMRMFPLRTEGELASFSLTKWKIREPSEELALSREDGVTNGDIDVVIVPGVAFDASCNRLGHGRGHYDCFLERVNKANEEKGRPRPLTLGVCFDEQVVDSIPTESCDVRLDFVLTPTRTFTSKGEVDGARDTSS